MSDFELKIKNIDNHYKENPPSNMFSIIKKSLGGRKVILYGAGRASILTFEYCNNEGIEVDCLCDKNKSGVHTPTGLKIISINDLITNHKEDIIIITSWKYEKQITEELTEKGFPKANIYPFRIRNRLTKKDFDNLYYSDYEFAYNYFSDEDSKNAVLDLYKSFVYSEILPPNTDNPCYFDDDVVKLSDNETFFDCGGYEGKTTLEFIKKVDGHYNTCYISEPAQESRKTAISNLKNYSNIKFISSGMFSNQGMLNFYHKCFDDSSFILNENSYSEEMLPITSFDTLFTDSKDSPIPTFIKFDIEGSETEAIYGGKNLIEKYKPKLAVSIYHRPQDMTEILKYLYHLRPDYKFSLRNYEYGYYDCILYAV